MQRTSVLYHGGKCLDGFTAAWIMHQHLPHADFFAVDYNKPPPSNLGEIVYMVDFMYQDYDTMVKIIEAAEQVHVFDHHVGSAKLYHELRSLYPNRMKGTFDLDRSGAGITWDSVMRGVPRPELVNFVEDHDLWRFTIPHTSDFIAGLAEQEQTWATWDAACANYKDVVSKGAMHNQNKKLIVEYEVTNLGQRITLPLPDPITIPAVHTRHPHYRSDIAASLLRHTGADVVAVTWFVDEGIRVRLVSPKGGRDVNAICTDLGGGGHKHAAGFLLPYHYNPK